GARGAAARGRAAPAASFRVSVAVSPVTAGVADDFLVTAHDAFGNVATGYAGTATFTSSDPHAQFTPASHAFNPATDAGSFLASVIFETAGSQTVTATDGAITGTSAAVTVNAAAAASLTQLVTNRPVIA